MTTKPLTDNMLEALHKIAAWATLGRDKVAANAAVDGNLWSALYRRHLFTENEQGHVTDFDYLTEEAWALVDRARMYEIIDGESRRLDKRVKQLEEKLRRAKQAQEVIKLSTIGTGHVKVEGRCYFAGSARPHKTWIIVPAETRQDEMEDRLEARARQADWRDVFGEGEGVVIDSVTLFGARG